MPIAVRLPLPITGTAADDPAERQFLAALDDFELFEGLGFFEPGPFEEPPPAPADDPAERTVAEAAPTEPEPDEPGWFEPFAFDLVLNDLPEIVGLSGEPPDEAEQPAVLFEPFAFDEIDDGIGVALAVELAAAEEQPDDAGFTAGPFDLVLNDNSEIVSLFAVLPDDDEVIDLGRSEPIDLSAPIVLDELPEVAGPPIEPEEEPDEPGWFESSAEFVSGLPAAEDIFGAADIAELDDDVVDSGSFEPSPLDIAPPPQLFGVIPPGLLEHWLRLRRREEARARPADASAGQADTDAAQDADAAARRPSRPQKPPPVIDRGGRIARQLQAVRSLEELRHIAQAARGVERRLLLELMQIWREHDLALARQRDEDDALAVLLMD